MGLFLTAERGQSPGVIAGTPAVLPPVVRQFSCRLHGEWAGRAPWDALELPPELRDAVPHRQMHFRAGRFCALQALQALQPGRAFEPPARCASGEPLWPADIAGSITHTDDFVSAAVVLTRLAAGIGIDSERIIPAVRATGIMPLVAWPSEIAHAREAGLDRLQALTLVFSAKETNFKSLFPLVRARFGFHDVRMIDVDPGARVFRARVVKTLSPQVPAGLVLEGRFAHDDSLMHTGMLIPVEPGTRNLEAIDAPL